MRRKEEVKRKRIIASMRSLILKKGYRNISIEDITNEAGIAKGSFYTYFLNKSLVINCILEDIILKIKNRNSFEKYPNLIKRIEDIVKERIDLNEEEIEDNLILISLSRNMASLDKSTLELLKIVDEIVIDEMENMMIDYSEDIKIKKEERRLYSKMFNGIIDNYKDLVFYLSEKDKDFNSDLESIKMQYKSKDFNRNIEIITDSIFKILTY